MSYDILTFMGEEPKAKSLAVEKYLEKNCDSKLWKHCHTKCRKSCCKSATTGIVIKKILKEKEMFDIKSIFWGRALGIRERERQRVALCSLVALLLRRKGRAWLATPSSAAVLSRGSFVYFDTDSCIFEIWGLKILKLLQNRSLVKCLIWNCDRSQLKRSASVNFMSNLAKQG